ncbi:BRO1-like domain-containing protein [Mycena floridula]|nr:BRO1-like domain-containing protein [Mycena floridula]
MSNNLLSIPFKTTYQTNVKDPTRAWLQANGGAHPDAFRADLNRWQELRKEVVGGTVHISRVEAILKYHAQLTAILTKLPADIQLEVAYAPAFQPDVVPITLRNLVFERAAVVFNLAALYSQLADAEDRNHIDGIKSAISYYQQASGTMSFLRGVVLQKLVFSPDDEQVPEDLSVSVIHSLEWLMLAQAQECFWQKAKLDNYKNGLIARLAANTASLYQQALNTIRDASPSVKHVFPAYWLSHIETKSHHFEAVAQYRKSIDELEASNYGLEIARLSQSQIEAKKAYDISRRGKVNLSVTRDAQSILEAVQKRVAQAERDNDLIYHHEVPPATAIPQIGHAAIAQLMVPPGLANPTSILGTNDVILGELLGWGAREAISIYNDRKNNLLEGKIIQEAKQQKALADSTLQHLNLPSSLEALERPMGLPPSLLKKAEEVRLENGPSKIEHALEDLQRLARQDLDILNEAMDILDGEASEDETIRRDNTRLDRLPSHEANVEFIEKERRYRSILDQARASDDTIRQKWDEWERNITELTWDEADLEASVPSSVSRAASSSGAETKKHSRALRVLLESLDTLERDRTQVVRRAQTLANADDIQPLILKAASGFERLTTVEPVMFETVSDAELVKYDKFIVDLGVFGTKQAEILASIKSRNDMFLQSRRDDSTVKDREHALQSLDLSYHKYQEIIQNLQEGIKFYNDLAGIFIQFRDSCKNWRNERKQEIYSLTRATRNVSLHSQEDERPVAVAPVPSSPKKRATGKSSGLPGINSSDWGFEELVPLRPPGSDK